jgi:IS30 family transposase
MPEETAALGTLVYFCDPASPWQRASNEKANGLLRQYFRKGADLGAVEQSEVRFAADEINGNPDELSTATAAGELPHWLPSPAVDISN